VIAIKTSTYVMGFMLWSFTPLLLLALRAEGNASPYQVCYVHCCVGDKKG